MAASKDFSRSFRTGEFFPISFGVPHSSGAITRRSVSLVDGGLFAGLGEKPALALIKGLGVEG